MIAALRNFAQDEQGQDLIEYSLLLTFIIFAVVGLFNGYSASIAGVTSVTNANLATANAFIH